MITEALLFQFLLRQEFRFENTIISTRIQDIREAGELFSSGDLVMCRIFSLWILYLKYGMAQGPFQWSPVNSASILSRSH